MGYRPYKGPVLTLEQASFAEFPVRITCERCCHFRQLPAIKALRQLTARKKDVAVKLFVPVTGVFRCGECQHRIVTITAPLQSTYR